MLTGNCLHQSVWLGFKFKPKNSFLCTSVIFMNIQSQMMWCDDKSELASVCQIIYRVRRAYKRVQQRADFPVKEFSDMANFHL